MRRSLLPVLLLACTTLTAQAQTPPAAAPKADPQQELASSAIPGVLAEGTKTQFVKGGYVSTEGVIGMPDGSLLFCEQNLNRIFKVDTEGNISLFLEHANRPIGLAFDPKGNLVAVQTNDPLVGVLSPKRATLADDFEGQRLVRPNDLVIDTKGGIYFTDPLPAPTVELVHKVPAGRKSLIFYLTPEGKLTKLTEEITTPNGLQLSPDEKTFYATNGDHVVAFDVQPDGSVKNPRKFVEFPKEVLPIDGMAVDNDGRLYITAMKGIQVVSPKGEKLGAINAPIRMQSLGFAGKDRKTLFVVGEGNLYKISTLAEGIKSRQK